MGIWNRSGNKNKAYWGVGPWKESKALKIQGKCIETRVERSSQKYEMRLEISLMNVYFLAFDMMMKQDLGW